MRRTLFAPPRSRLIVHGSLESGAETRTVEIRWNACYPPLIAGAMVISAPSETGVWRPPVKRTSSSPDENIDVLPDLSLLGYHTISNSWTLFPQGF